MNTEVPTDALDRLKRAAYGDTGGSQAARYFLFWCVGQDDPTGYKGQGALELAALIRPSLRTPLPFFSGLRETPTATSRFTAFWTIYGQASGLPKPLQSSRQSDNGPYGNA